MVPDDVALLPVVPAVELLEVLELLEALDDGLEELSDDFVALVRMNLSDDEAVELGVPVVLDELPVVPVGDDEACCTQPVTVTLPEWSSIVLDELDVGGCVCAASPTASASAIAAKAPVHSVFCM